MIARFVTSCLLAIALGAFLVSCASSPTLSSIQVTPATASVAAVGGTAQFTATATYTRNGHPPTNQNVTAEVTWASSSTDVATVNSSGLASAVGNGTASITATMSSSFGPVVGTASLTVTTGGTGGLTVITLYPAAPTIPQIGQTTQFLALGTFTPPTANDDLTDRATWASSNVAIATINSTGLATATGCGTTTITAEYQGILGTMILTVSCATTQNITGITLYPSSPTIPQAGQTTQFLALGTNSQNSSGTDLTRTAAWSSSNVQVATINGTGLATAVACGPTTVTAEYQGVVGQALLTISCSPPTSLTLFPTAPVIPQIGQPTQFLANGIFGGTPTDVTQKATWTSSNTTVATINSTGDAAVVGCGTTTISAEYEGVLGNAQLDSTCTIGQNQTFSSVVVDPVGPVIPQIGQTTQFLAVGTFEQGGQTDLTNSATWASSNQQVATVTANGTATAVSCGTTTISAEYESIIGQSLLTISCTPIVSDELLVTKTGNVSGTVTSQPAGINCGTDCSALFNDGTGLLLTATPSPASWTGCDQVINNVCSFTIRNSKQTVTANF